MLAALGVNVPVIYVTIFLIGSALAGVGGSLPRLLTVLPWYGCYDYSGVFCDSHNWGIRLLWGNRALFMVSFLTLGL